MKRDFFYPIAITYPDWDNIHILGEGYFNESPTRGIDRCPYLDINAPSSYIRCLDFKNKPEDALKCNDNRLGHFFVSMGIVSDYIVLLNKYTVLKIYPVNGLLILSGSLYDWVLSIVLSCREDNDPKFIRIMNHAMIILDGLGFRDVFSEYEKVKVNDYFYLRKR